MKKVFIIGAILMLSVLITGCSAPSPNPQQIDKATQDSILSQGQTVEPVYKTQNFLARKAINKWSQRMDDPSKIWYVYEFSDTGSVLRYYISSTVPLSYGVGLTNPQQVIDDPYGNYDAGGRIISAPGVDGVYYGGVDEDLYFFFDAETDALVMTNNRLSFADRPIAQYADAPLVTFKSAAAPGSN